MKEPPSPQKIERAKRARLVRAMADLTAVEFSKYAGVSDRTIKGWENANDNALTEKGAEKILNAAKKVGIIVDMIWLLHGVGSQPRLTQDVFNKSILPDPQLSEDMLSSPAPFSEKVKQEMTCFIESNLNAVTMQILDQTMEPFFQIGDIVGGIRLFGPQINLALSKFCIIETKDYPLICRRLLLGTKEKLFNLQCTNPLPGENACSVNQKLFSAAPIIWVRKP